MKLGEPGYRKLANKLEDEVCLCKPPGPCKFAINYTDLNSGCLLNNLDSMWKGCSHPNHPCNLGVEDAVFEDL